MWNLTVPAGRGRCHAVPTRFRWAGRAALVLMSVLAVTGSLLVATGSSRALAVEPVTAPYESEENVYSNLHLLGGELHRIVPRDGSQAVERRTGSGWQVLRTARTLAVVDQREWGMVLSADDELVVVRPDGTVVDTPIDGFPGPDGILDRSGVFHPYDATSPRNLWKPDGTITHALLRADQDVIGVVTGISSSTVYTAPRDGTLGRVVVEITAAKVLPDLLGADGRIWWSAGGVRPTSLCSVALDGSGRTCRPLSTTMGDCVATGRTRVMSADDVRCVVPTADRSALRLVSLGADQVPTTVTFDTKPWLAVGRTVDGQQVVTAAASDGTTALWLLDFGSGTVRHVGTAEAREGSAIVQVSLSQQRMLVRYASGRVFLRDVGQQAAGSGLVVSAGAADVGLSGSRWYVTTLSGITHVHDGNAPSTLSATGDVRAITGPYLRSGAVSGLLRVDGTVLPTHDMASAGPGSLWLRNTPTGFVVEDARGVLAPRTVTVAPVGPVELVGEWLRAGRTLVNLASGERLTVSLSGRLGQGVFIDLDGSAWDLATGAGLQWHTDARASVLHVDDDRVAWLGGDGRLRVTDFGTSADEAPRLLGDLTDTVTTAGSSSARMELDYSEGVSAGVLDVMDASGRLIRSIPTPAATNGAVRGVAWDGRDSSGAIVGSGDYRWVHHVRSTDGTREAVSLDGSTARGDWAVRGSPVDSIIAGRYWASADLRGRLGPPTTPEVCGLVDGGCYRRYVGGHLHWSPASGVHETVNPMMAAWGALGWERGVLRYPTAGPVCGLVRSGCYQKFQGGHLHTSPASGTHATWGPMMDKWGSSSWERGRLGYPLTDPRCGLVRGGCYQTFEGGQIHWSPGSGAWVTDKGSAITKAWAAQGYERGAYGYPVGDRRCDSTQVCRQEFQNLLLFTVEGDPRIVRGAIRSKWASLGENPLDWSWLPAHGERCGLSRGGCYQTFGFGQIHWSPKTGAHTTYIGSYIRFTWEQQGFERGALGYPTSDEACTLTGGWCFQRFEGGNVYSRRSPYAATVVPTVILNVWGKHGYERGRLGYPQWGAHDYGTHISQEFYGGYIEWNKITRTARVSFK